MNEKSVSLNENTPPDEAKAPLLGTLERGLAILDLLAELRRATVSEISERLNLKRSTVYRLVDNLRQRGYVESIEGTAEVCLGKRALSLGLAAISQTDLLTVVAPFMRELASSGFGTVFVAIPDSDSVVYVARVEGPQSLNLSARLGTRRPMHCTGLGKAYLSGLNADERELLVSDLPLTPQTPNTITSHRELLAELHASAERGYAIDDLENEPGVACVAAPIRNFQGTPVAALSIAGVAETVLSDVEELGIRTMKTADAVSSEMGWKPTER